MQMPTNKTNQTTNKKTNKEIVTILKEALASMEVKDVNKFEIRAYQNAAAAIDNLTTSVFELWENNRLKEIPGVGTTLASHLDELFNTGTVKRFEELQSGLPQGMFSLIGIRGIGAKKALKLAMAFKLATREDAVEKLKLVAEAGKIRNLESFGEKSEQDILKAITETKMTKNEKQRLLLYQAEEIAERLINYIKECKAVLQVEALGSLRRRNSTVGDLDIAVSTNDSEQVIAHFMKFSEIEDNLGQGEKKARVVLKNDIQVDLRTSTPEAFGSMMQYFTGSKQHNVILRTYALEHGKSLSEYGIKFKDKLHEFADEEGFYKFVGLQYIPPELRSGKNEVETAHAHKIPQLIELSDLKGDLHTHTNDSDGINSFEEMTAEAIRLGYEYYGVSDHAPSVQNRGYAEVAKIIKEKRAKIEKFNKSQNKLKVLFGYEVNILADATLALPDELLKELDYVIASVHTSFTQDREKMTERLVKALENPYVTILGHPTGRLINEREACDVNWAKVFEAASANHKIIEINSQPNRLDLTDDLVKEALEYGIKFIISTDAHAIDQLHMMRYGVDVARRGWLTKESVVNQGMSEFLQAIR